MIMPKTSPISTEIYQSEKDEISNAVISEYSNAFRHVFTHHPYGQYLFYPSEGKAISANEVFSIRNKHNVSLGTLDCFDPRYYPPHDESHEQAIYWQDPERTYECMREKLLHHSILVMIRDQIKKRLLGAALGRFVSIKQAFETEEWKNPFHYSTYSNPKQLRHLHDLIMRINLTLQQESNERKVDANTEIFLWNCIFTTFEGRGKGFFPLLAQHLMDSVPEDKNHLLAIGEVVVGSKPYEICQKIGTRFATGFLNPDPPQDGDTVLYISTVEKFKEQFCS